MASWFDVFVATLFDVFCGNIDVISGNTVCDVFCGNMVMCSVAMLSDVFNVRTV